MAIISRDTGPVGELIATALQSNGPEATLPEGVEPLPVLLIGQRTRGIARLREMVSDGAGG